MMTSLILGEFMVNIRQVENNRDLRKFVRFANDMYADNPYFVPALLSDEMNTFRKDKNPAYEFCESALFIAYIDGKAVGRIGVLVNHKNNEKNNQKHARFTSFDFIDDFQISKALMDKAIQWARDNGFNFIHGPLGVSDLDHQGMLIEGFDEMDLFITIYNHPYYKEHLEKLGFSKEVDWLEYQIPVPSEPSEKYTKIAEMSKKKYGYKVIEFKNKKDILPWANDIFELYNTAYAPLYGVTELSNAQINMYIDSFFGFVNPEFVKIILNKEGEAIGFGITMPSLSKAMKKAKGRLFPFGFIHILRAIKKNDTLDMYLVGIHPDYQHTGAAAILVDSILRSAIKNGITMSETGPELEGNKEINKMWKYTEHRQHRRRRVYGRSI